MILLFGPANDPMMARIADALQAKNAEFLPVLTDEIPHTVRLTFGHRNFLSDSNGNRVALADVGSIYHRVGFSGFQAFQDYSQAEVDALYNECISALHGYLNTCDALVVNRPFASETNASKPEQGRLLENLGFLSPDTLITNRPDEVREFYKKHKGELIYKSISYVRSIVHRFEPQDLERLDELSVCPIQLQQRVEGVDTRVHVVGDKLFATQVRSDSSDYRYDRESEVLEVELPEAIERLCLKTSKALNFHVCGIDLRITPDGKVYCFEVNPSPAFTWYEDRTEQPIGAAIADLLIEND